MQERKSFKILIAGLQGVGKSTIIQRFEDGYNQFKAQGKKKSELKKIPFINSFWMIIFNNVFLFFELQAKKLTKINFNHVKQKLKNNFLFLIDGEDKLVDLDIQLIPHTISSRAIDDDEYVTKKPNELNQYNIIVIVYDLGQKDSIKEIAHTIKGSSLNFEKLNQSSKFALWGNKVDLFNFDSDTDERTAQKQIELEGDLGMFGNVRCNSLNTEKNEPFQYYLKEISQVRSSNSSVSESNSSGSNRSNLNNQEIPKEFIKGSKARKTKDEDNSFCSFSSSRKQNVIPIDKKEKSDATQNNEIKEEDGDSIFKKPNARQNNKNKKDKKNKNKNPDGDGELSSGECSLI